MRKTVGDSGFPAISTRSKLIDCDECRAQGEIKVMFKCCWQLFVIVPFVGVGLSMPFWRFWNQLWKLINFTDTHTHTVGRYLGQQSDNNPPSHWKYLMVFYKFILRILWCQWKRWYIFTLLLYLLFILFIW